MSIRHTPDCDYLTCEAFGMKNFPLPVSTSNHLIIDLADVKQRPPESSSKSFLLDELEVLRTVQEVEPTSAALAEALKYWKCQSEQPGANQTVTGPQETSFLGALAHDSDKDAPAMTLTQNRWQFIVIRRSSSRCRSGTSAASSSGGT